MDNRVERIVLETDRHLITGDLTMPKDGYRSRLSDFLNRGDIDFVPLVSVEVRPIEGGDAVAHEFLAVARTHIQLAYHHKNGDQ
ncbi:MAG: hypothetical protein QOJ01_959 [Solirubrobacterales bacterium]|jgi:hypothetical protein|nr:hypothetical protein [Solirubrobacterales bacterium]